MKKMTEMNFKENWVGLVDACDRKGWEWQMSRMLTEHPDDWYLVIVLVKNEKGEYVTYLYNSTIGEYGSFNHGHYFTNFKLAEDDFYRRS
jgi:hypothetical protein